MKLDPPRKIAYGYGIRVTATARRGETDTECLERMYSAALDAMPEGEQAQRWFVDYQRDRGVSRQHSRRIHAHLLTGPQRTPARQTSTRTPEET